MARVTASVVAQWIEDGLAWPMINQRIVADRITAEELDGIFDNALRNDDLRPSRESYEALAKDIWLLRERGWPYGLQEEQWRRYRRVVAAADGLLFEINSWAELSNPGDEPEHPFVRLREVLAEFAHPVALAPPTSPLGRPNADWHKYGREFAKLIEAALENAGYLGPISKTDEKSATAIICVELVDIAFDLDIKPSGFASAMRERRARKKKSGRSLVDLFPEAARLLSPDE
jgi:hypothetical protein